MVGSDATRVWLAGWTAGGCTEVGWVERGVLGWFEVEWGVVCEWDVPVSMLGKSLKVAVSLSGPKTVIFRAYDATRVWTAGG